MNFERSHDKYLDPPDDDPVCEDGCGELLERDNITREWYCPNKFCPLKFDEGTTEREMAEMLIGATETVKSLQRQLKRTAVTNNGK